MRTHGISTETLVQFLQSRLAVPVSDLLRLAPPFDYPSSLEISI